MRKVKAGWTRGCVLVCTHERPPGAEKASCGNARGNALRDALKSKMKAEGLKGQVLVAKSGCLDVCSALGVTVAILPDPASGRPRRVLVVDPVAEADEAWAQARDVLLGDGHSAPLPPDLPEGS